MVDDRCALQCHTKKLFQIIKITFKRKFFLLVHHHHPIFHLTSVFRSENNMISIETTLYEKTYPNLTITSWLHKKWPLKIPRLEVLQTHRKHLFTYLIEKYLK